MDSPVSRLPDLAEWGIVKLAPSRVKASRSASLSLSATVDDLPFSRLPFTSPPSFNYLCPGPADIQSQPLRVKRLAPEAIVPTRGSSSAAGFDLYASRPATVPARGKAMVDTDISIALPEGTYGRIAPRSGLGELNSDV